MKAAVLKYPIISAVATLITVILILIPFHAFLTVWLSTGFGNYTALRLWKEALLIVCAVGAVYLLLTDTKIRSHTLSRRLVWIIASYCLLQIVYGLIQLKREYVSPQALGYGLISDLRYLVFFLITWAIALRTSRLHSRWQRIILIPAILVVPFALIQEFFLTPRFLEHFGYSQFTILPFQYVDNQPDLLRVQSTLRGANPLGAYLLIIISVLLVMIIRAQETKRRVQLIALETACLFALYFTYSRSAWLGAAIAAGIISCLAARTHFKRLGAVTIAAILLIVLTSGLWLQHNRYAQSALLHTSDTSSSRVTSNGVRLSSIKQGVSDIAHEPLGRGAGSAGQASVYNKPREARISENYFLQIGQEVGWPGLALFVLINAGVGYLLFLHRHDALALSLFASLAGLTIVNMLSHAWADDTLAYIWWGFAGVAMAPRAILADRVKPDEQ